LKLNVFTDDPQLISTIRQVAPDPTVLADLDLAISAGDIHIWDIDTSSHIPPSILDGRDSPLLIAGTEKSVSAADHEVLLRCCPLLKPVNVFSMRAFLDLAVAGRSCKQKALTCDELTSDRETLLEYTLATNLRLQQYDRQRTNFLSRALHDMRAPLTALHGYCELLADGRLGSVTPQQQELLVRMQASTRRLLRQSTGMFELSVLGHVRRKPQLVQADIEEVIAQAMHDTSILAQEKDIEVSTLLEPPSETLLLEPEQMTQVFLNILENCCKFTPQGGSIQLFGSNIAWDFGAQPLENPHRPSGYRVDIQDNGPGIQHHLLSSIFEEYTSYSGGQDRSGGGLGLAISKMIVTAHGGSIFATNANPGAKFSIVLPFERAASLSPAEDINPPVLLQLPA